MLASEPELKFIIKMNGVGKIKKVHCCKGQLKANYDF